MMRKIPFAPLASGLVALLGAAALLSSGASAQEQSTTPAPKAKRFPLPQPAQVGVERLGFPKPAQAGGDRLAIPASEIRAATELASPERIWSGDLVKLERDKKFYSPDGNHYLVHQQDGNLVVYDKRGRYVWGIERVTDRFRDAFQVDFGGGDIVVRDLFERVIWAALDPVRDADARVTLGPDGVLRIRNAGGEALWGSDGKGNPDAATPSPKPVDKPVDTGTTPGPAPQSMTAATQLPVSAGLSLEPGRAYDAPSGGYRLTFQAADGNLVLKRTNGSFVWGLADAFRGYRDAKRIAMLTDGSLVALDAAGRTIWTAPSNNRVPNSTLTVSPSGALQVVAPNGELTWSSNGNLTADLPAAARLPLQAGQSLEKGKTYEEGRFQLKFESGGNLVITGTGGGGYQWSLADSFPGYKTGDSFRYNADGTLEILDKTGKSIWRPQLAERDPKALLKLTSAGVLQLVSEAKGIVLWSSNGLLFKPVDVFAQSTESCPEDEAKAKQAAGWPKCIMLGSPKIKILGSSLTSQSAMKGVAGVYRQMFDALDEKKYPKSTFDGFTVYLTNGEAFSEIKKLPPVGTMWPDIPGEKGGDFLRGGASRDYLWIEEQMICKNGVKTRNLRRANSDNSPRSFDQVVHEMGHSMEDRYPAFRAENDRQFAGRDRVEGVPWGIQAWFGVGGQFTDAQKKYLSDSVFKSRIAFSCDNYQP